MQGNQRAGTTFDTKAEAQAKGRDMARERGTEHVVKKMDGTVGETKWRGADPASYRSPAASRGLASVGGHRCSRHCSRPTEGDASVGGLTATLRLPPVLLRFGGR
ncbi:MAG: DUF2188 domain-containing protein [Propionibacteriaceae bacterium]|nr:DUF2188 domain-containing protein [Propionibacteriaceae bacterium]